MQRRTIRAAILGIAAAAAALTAAAATVSSPYRPTASPISAAAPRRLPDRKPWTWTARRSRRCARPRARSASRASPSRRGRSRRSPCSASRSRRTRASPCPARTARSSLPFPSIAHFAGSDRGRARLVGLPLGAARRALRVRPRGGAIRLTSGRPSPSGDFVARSADSPANDAARGRGSARRGAAGRPDRDGGAARSRRRRRLSRD